MTDNLSIFEQLKADNPFMSSMSPLPWENKSPDLVQLNNSVSENIEQLIREKRRQPSLPLSGLIFGEAGMGKTHMIARILRKLRKNAWPTIFVAVRASTNPKRITQELLSEICICLTKQHSNGHTQFDMLMDKVMESFHEHRREDGFNTTDIPDLKTYLKRDMPTLDKAFMKCLMISLTSTDIAARDQVIEWLREGLDDEDSLALGLPMRDVNSMEDAERESAAKNIITSLGVVLAYANVSMIVCFDELDTMHDKELIKAWGYVVAFLMNNIAGILPLCFIRSWTWMEEFRPVLDTSTVQRLQIHTMKMKGCSVAQARQLIRDRIAERFSEGVDEKYSWIIAKMGNTLQNDQSPRDVINLARQAVNAQTDPHDSIRDVYGEEFKKVQTELNAWPANANHINLTLRAWLNSHDNVHLLAKRSKYIEVCGIIDGRHFAFIVVVPKVHTTATAAAGEGIRFLKEYPDAFCCYVMEMKPHKKTWKKFIATLDEFKALGGYVAELNDTSRIQWYALTSTINQINNGNVNLYLSQGSRTAALSDAAGFLRSIDLVPGLFTPSQPPHAPTPEPQTEPQTSVKPVPIPANLKSAVLSVLKASPMNIVTTEKALAMLTAKKINVSRNDLLAFINSAKDTFTVYPSKGGSDVMIGLTGKK